jgi:hypothetical protein
MSETNTEIAKQAIEAQQSQAEANQVAEGAASERRSQIVFADEDEELERLLAQEAAAKAGASTGETKEGESDSALGKEPEQSQKGAEADGKAMSSAAKATGASVESALIALRKKLSEISAANLMLQGENRALRAMVESLPEQGAGGAKASVSTDGEEQDVAQQLEAIDKAFLQIAEDVDEGKISMKEAEERRIELRRQERMLLQRQQQELLASVSSGPQSNDLGLQEHLMQLIREYPVLNRLTREQLEPYERIAYMMAEAEGRPIPEGPLGTKELRTRMAQLAERDFDPESYARRLQARSKTSGGGAAHGKAGATDGKSAAGAAPTAAEREAKLKLAASMPPDIGSIGAGATGGEISEDHGAAVLFSLKDEEAAIKWLEANPQFVKKVMGRSMRFNR